MIIDYLSWIAILLGGFFLISGGVGLLRFPDFFTRMHAAGVTDTLGAGLVLLGLMFQTDGQWLVLFKLLFILLFILITSPTATHALAKAALHHKQKPLLGERARGINNGPKGRDQ